MAKKLKKFLFFWEIWSFCAYKIVGGDIMIQLSNQQLSSMYGKVITASALLGYPAVAAGVAAIIKILTSSKGRVSVPGINITWGN